MILKTVVFAENSVFLAEKVLFEKQHILAENFHSWLLTTLEIPTDGRLHKTVPQHQVLPCVNGMPGSKVLV